MKRGLVISDTHCGHLIGLTPPSWQIRETDASPRRRKFSGLQAAMWSTYCQLLEASAPYDFVIDVGDMIEGKGDRSGGTELITADREEQCAIATECRLPIHQHLNLGAKWVGVYGTPYHAGSGEDWENMVADKMGYTKIGGHEWIDVNGCIIDIKHKVGASVIPHGRYTAVARERLWNVLWNERGQAPKANIIIRGHVHYATYCGEPGWVAMTMPALQGMGSKYGVRQCVGTVHWGITVLEIDDDGVFDFSQRTINLTQNEIKPVQI